MARSPEIKAFSADPSLATYVADAFGPEDPVLARVRARAAAADLPAIHVSAFDGRLIELIARSCAPVHIVEIGTLAGYSGICLARALAPGGHLHTLEVDPRHAAIAQQSFEDAGLTDRIQIHVGPALASLAHVSIMLGPIDLVFIDADKASYPAYVRWASQNLRPGGIVLVDNAFAFGLVGQDPRSLTAPDEIATRTAIDETNRLLADPQGAFRAGMVPTGEGLAMAVRVR